MICYNYFSIKAKEDLNMIICNTTLLDGVNRKEISVNFPEATIPGFLTYKENKVVVSEDTNDDNIFMKGLIGEDEHTYRRGEISPNRKKDITYKLIEDTEDNPLLITMCESVEFYVGIQTNIKVLIAGDVMFVMLISGVCSIDGITLARCYNGNIANRKSVKYDCKKMQELLSWVFKDMITGYDYSRDAVANISIKYSDERNYSAGVVNKEDLYFFNNNLEENIRKYEEKRARKEEEKRQRLEYLHKESERIAKERKESEAKKEESKRSDTFETVNVGAQQFRDLLNSFGRK